MEENSFRSIGATTFLAPLPAVMVGVSDPTHPEREGNLITIGWTGICCTKPPMLTLSIKKERYSYALLKESGECTVNLVNDRIVRACDLCGVKSGRDTDKFSASGLSPMILPDCTAPAVAQSPVCLTCRVESVTELGSHDLFLCRITGVHVADRYFRKDGSIDMAAMKLCAYAHGEYFALGEMLGFFGCSVAGKQALKKRGK